LGRDPDQEGRSRLPSEIAMKPDPDPGPTRVGAFSAYVTALLATLAAFATSLGGAGWGPIGP
jgi:hypothetical protein